MQTRGLLSVLWGGLVAQGPSSLPVPFVSTSLQPALSLLSGPEPCPLCTGAMLVP